MLKDKWPEAQFPEDQLAKMTKFIGFLKLISRVHNILNMIDLPG